MVVGTVFKMGAVVYDELLTSIDKTGLSVREAHSA